MVGGIMGITAVRGAICVKEDAIVSIEEAVAKLWKAIITENHLEETDIAFVLFTQTEDLKSRNPAGALRKGGWCKEVPLFCMQEPEITGMMPRVIRLLVVLKEETRCLVPVYLDGAERLRPDLRQNGVASETNVR